MEYRKKSFGTASFIGRNDVGANVSKNRSKIPRGGSRTQWAPSIGISRGTTAGFPGREVISRLLPIATAHVWRRSRREALCGSFRDARSQPVRSAPWIGLVLKRNGAERSGAERSEAEARAERSGRSSVRVSDPDARRRSIHAVSFRTWFTSCDFMM